MRISRFPAALFFLFSLLLAAGSAPALAAPGIAGNSAVLIDAHSGQVLYEKNMHEKLPPASTTKMLTAIMAIESGRLDEIVTVGPNSPLVEGTRVYIDEGEKVTLRRLVEAAIIHSANDAAWAIAEHLGGSVAGFAVMMNEKAKAIGAQNSNFVNPHGLTQEGHYSTAYDLAIIGQYAMRNEIFRQIVQMKTLDWEGQAWQTRLINKNELLWSYDGANGIKTGYTREAKNTIVASANREGRNYIAAVLGSSGDGIWKDARNLLDYGFLEFQQIKLAQAGEAKASLSFTADQKLQLITAQSFELSVPHQVGGNKLESRVVLKELKDKITEGEETGQIIYLLDGEEVGRIPLVAGNSISAPFNFGGLILYIISGIFGLQVCWRLYRLLRRKRRRNYEMSSYGSYYKGY